LQKVALISSLQITAVVGKCDEDCSSGCVTPCATAGEVNAINATVNGINLIASQRPFQWKGSEYSKTQRRLCFSLVTQMRLAQQIWRPTSKMD
jgi:hypothetical protein